MGLQHARKAESTNPLTIAKSYLSMAGLTTPWDELFEKYGREKTTQQERPSPLNARTHIRICKQMRNSKIPGHFPTHIRPFGTFYAANSIEIRHGLD